MALLRPKILRVFGAALIVCCVCAGAAYAQVPKTVEEPYVAPKDQALLVFSRPRHRQASETDFRIVDKAGRCVALLKNGWQVATPLWPGKHMLMIVTGEAPPTVQLMQAKLSAGKTYIVQLRARVNVKSPVGMEVIRRADQPLEQFPQDIKAQSPFPQELRSCTEWVSWKRAKIEPRASTAKRKWDEATDESRDEQTVRRNDGWTATEIASE